MASEIDGLIEINISDCSGAPIEKVELPNSANLLDLRRACGLTNNQKILVDGAVVQDDFRLSDYGRSPLSVLIVALGTPDFVGMSSILEGTFGENEYLGKWLPDEFKTADWRLGFRMSRDFESDASKLFDECPSLAELSPTLFLVKATDGSIFGGYASCPWKSIRNQGWCEDVHSFVFVLKGSPAVGPMKLEAVSPNEIDSNEGHLYSREPWLACFNYALYIHGNMKDAKNLSRSGKHYKFPEEEQSSQLFSVTPVGNRASGDHSFAAEEIEIFAPSSEEIPSPAQQRDSLHRSADD